MISLVPVCSAFPFCPLVRCPLAAASSLIHNKRKNKTYIIYIHRCVCVCVYVIHSMRHMFFGPPHFPFTPRSLQIYFAHILCFVYILRALFILGSFLALPFALHAVCVCVSPASFSDSIFHISLLRRTPTASTHTHTHRQTERLTHKYNCTLSCFVFFCHSIYKNKMCVPDDDDDDVACPVRDSKSATKRYKTTTTTTKT